MNGDAMMVRWSSVEDPKSWVANGNALTARSSTRGTLFRCEGECHRGWLTKGPMLQHLLGGAHGLPLETAERVVEWLATATRL